MNLKKKYAKLSVVILTAIIVFSLSITAMANTESYEGRNINILAIYGDSAYLSRGTPAQILPRAGQRLSDGNILSTGEDTSIFIQFDGDSVLRMDEHSRIAVASSRNRLVLSLQSGSALVHVASHTPGNTTESRVGNIGLTVRGTMYVIAIDENQGVANVHMLSGHGELIGNFGIEMIPAGYSVVIGEDDADWRINVSEIDIAGLDLFTLLAIYDNAEYLLEQGNISIADLERVIATLRDEYEHAVEIPGFVSSYNNENEDSHTSSMATPTPTPPVSPPNYAGNGDGNGNGGSNGIPDEDIVISTPPPTPTPPTAPDTSPSPSPEPPSPSPTPSPTLPSSIGIYNAADFETFFGGTAPIFGDFYLGGNINVPGNFRVTALFNANLYGGGFTLNIGSGRIGSLFNEIGSDGEISNVRLEGSPIAFNTGNTGALAASNNGDLRGIISTIDINSINHANIGGLVGINSGIISESAVIGDISGSSGANDMGGIVARNLAMGIVERSFFYGGLGSSAAAVGHRIGGIAAVNYGTIRNVYSAGEIFSNGNDIGGIVGTFSGGLIEHSLSTIGVTGNHRVAGIAGVSNSATGSIRNNFAANSHIIGTLPNEIARIGLGNSYLFNNNWAYNYLVTSPASSASAIHNGTSNHILANTFSGLLSFDATIWNMPSSPGQLPNLAAFSAGLQPHMVLAFALEMPMTVVVASSEVIALPPVVVEGYDEEDKEDDEEDQEDQDDIYEDEDICEDESEYDEIEYDIYEMDEDVKKDEEEYCYTDFDLDDNSEDEDKNEESYPKYDKTIPEEKYVMHEKK